MNTQIIELRTALTCPLAMVCFFASPFVMAEELDLTPRLLYQIDGDNGDDYFGFNVSPWADLNGDGIMDFVSGTWYSREAPSYLRMIDGLNGAELGTILGVGCNFGSHSGCGPLGDLDGDGIPEFTAIIEHIREDRPSEVKIYSRTELYRTQASGSFRGIKVGDLDQDDTVDYAISTFSGVGSDISIHSGKTGIELLHLDGDPQLHMVGGIKDLNGDSIPDLAVRRRFTSGSGPRFDITFISGTFRGSSPLSQIDEKFLLGGYDQESIMGHSRYTIGSGEYVWNASDLDNDGLDDLVVHIEKSTNRYRLVAVSSDQSKGVLWETERWTGLRRGPRTLAAIGDLDQDGVTDFVTGITTNGGGSGDWGIFIFSGKTGALLFNMPGTDRSHDFFGLSVAAIDDLDGDGILEVAIGDPRIRIDGEDDPSYPGRVLVYSFGPASRNEAPDPQEQLQISHQTNGIGMIVAWPTTVASPMLEMSTDLLEWEPVFDGPAPASGQYVIPDQRPERKMYYRLRYDAP